MKGRKPKLQVVDASFTAGQTCPEPPDWLTSQAACEWRRAAPELHGRGMLAPDTLASLESYCVAVGAVRELEQTMSRDGRLVETPEGPKPHPAFRMQQTYLREARLMAAELGLTPQRRGALKPVEREVRADGWDELLA